MKASVSLITYNQAPYIAQAIESALMQRTDFDFEILIGEDDSTDGTREIVQRYQAKNPERIRVLLNERKNVVYVNGKPTGQWNFSNNIKNTRGEYVALLEGDDYWTSPDKLQRQVDFLENNRDCALCFHNVRIRDESEPGDLALHHSEAPRDRYEIEDLLKGNFMHTCSVVFRSGLFGDFPPWYFKCPLGDWPLHILNARHGRIGYLHEVMGVYRRHSGGLWSTQAHRQVLANSIQCAECIRAILTPAQKHCLDTTVRAWYLQVMNLCNAEDDPTEAARFATAYFKSFFFRKEPGKRRLLKLLARAKLRSARHRLMVKVGTPPSLGK